MVAGNSQGDPSLPLKPGPYSPGGSGAIAEVFSFGSGGELRGRLREEVEEVGEI